MAKLHVVFKRFFTIRGPWLTVISIVLNVFHRKVCDVVLLSDKQTNQL